MRFWDRQGQLCTALECGRRNFSEIFAAKIVCEEEPIRQAQGALTWLI